MHESPQPDDAGGESLQILRQDPERTLCRLGRDDPRVAVLAAAPSTEHPSPAAQRRLAHEFSLRDVLDAAWSLRPLDLVRAHGRLLMVVDWPGGDWLDGLLGVPLETGRFLRLAVRLAEAVGRMHDAGLVHKDLKPANVLLDPATGQVRLAGFGIATRLPRERQLPAPPELIDGSLPYMSPEQTGRMNRSIDARSDLYSLGVVFHEMLTGGLPFQADDAMGWVHCHVARPPRPPHERVGGIPEVVSAITMRLLAKTPEERYQTASAVERDLRRCLADWLANGRVEPFVPGEHDLPDRLRVPERLYGREAEIATLLAAFERTAAGGRAELVLVSGYSGVGKSAIVNELHKALVPLRGLFAAGKFDQFKRDIPYATLAQAFQGLVRPLLGRSEAALRAWREALLEALGPHGRLVVDLVPDLRHVIGEQPPVPELGQQEAQVRLHGVLRRFIGVFAQPEHPLALFLDDLQWLDAATLDLLEHLLTQPGLHHLLLIGAYRDNEVSATHPLARKLEAMRRRGAAPSEIVLAPLATDSLEMLLADALGGGPERVAPLAALVHEKTRGNPFFAIQFILALADERLLAPDHDTACWTWDLARIHAKGYTDNVVALMVDKLRRLPPPAQEALQEFACLGNVAEVVVLQRVFECPADGVHERLGEAVAAGLVLRTEDGYRFLHDRVQEAAYSRIAPERRDALHLRLGLLLAAHTPAGQLEEMIFEIVNQLNRGAHLVTDPAQRERLARLDLLAGRRARASTAYASALKLLRVGRSVLTPEHWETHPALVFELETLIAECELLTDDAAAAEARLADLAGRARTPHDFAVVTHLRLTVYTTLTRSERGIEVFLDYLARHGTRWPPHPTPEDVLREYDRIGTLLAGRGIESLVDLPLADDPDVLDMLDVCTEIVTPASFFDANLLALVLCRMVCLSLEHGNCDASCFGYVFFATLAGPRFGNYADGLRFGQLGHDLVERRGLLRYQARTCIAFGNMIVPWSRHFAAGRELIRRGFDAAYRNGDLTFAAYSWHALVTNCLAAGDLLPETQAEADKGIAFARGSGFGMAVLLCGAQLGLIRTLRGQAPVFGELDPAACDEQATERQLAEHPILALAGFFYWTRKLQARWFADDVAAAVEAARQARRLLWSAPSQLETADFRFFAALAHAAAWHDAAPHERPAHFECLRDDHRQLQAWAAHCPGNFADRVALVDAEIARVEGRVVDAEHLYERAIRTAGVGGFVHVEAVAHACAARFHAARGLARIAAAYLLHARRAFLRWGADGKARQLEARHPEVFAEWLPGPAGRSLSTTVEQLDLATILRISQVVSGETDLDRLVDALMRAALEHAGAQRGLLVLPVDEGPGVRPAGGVLMVVGAEATTADEGVRVRLPRVPVAPGDLPDSVLHVVLRTGEALLLNDASVDEAFAQDDYVRRRRSRSILCLPLLKQGRVTGVLYLENALGAHVFTPARAAMLKLLASEAATSLENARLYGELKEREARLRRLFDANLIGVFIWNLDGRIADANEALLRLTGHDRADLSSGRLHVRDLTPEDWRRDAADGSASPAAAGSARPVEMVYRRKDGTQVPVLVGAAMIDGASRDGVAFVVDLTDLKRAEEAARENERRYREVQAELAHANRVATVGHLSASIAHEVNQPLAGILTNADTCVRMLTADPPDIAGALETARRSIRDARRAAEVIARLRALLVKKTLSTAPVDMNDALREVVALSADALRTRRVSVRLDCAAELPPVSGNRVQLQQVLLNLFMNASEAMSRVDDRPRELVVRTRPLAEGGVELSVRDTGPGFDPDIAEKMFGAFYTTKSAGMGMGLSISRSIVESHRGRLWATLNEGPGATFHCTIPQGSEQAPDVRAYGLASAPPGAA